VTAEAKFANALDRFQALVLNMKSGGGSWRSHGITREDVLRRMEPVRVQLPQLWPVVMEVIERFGAAGVLG
jgi:putative hydrolase of HD superfamily